MILSLVKESNTETIWPEAVYSAQKESYDKTVYTAQKQQHDSVCQLCPHSESVFTAEKYIVLCDVMPSQNQIDITFVSLRDLLWAQLVLLNKMMWIN